MDVLEARLLSLGPRGELASVFPEPLPSSAALGGWAKDGWPGLPRSSLQVPGLFCV